MQFGGILLFVCSLVISTDAILHDCKVSEFNGYGFKEAREFTQGEGLAEYNVDINNAEKSKEDCAAAACVNQKEYCLTAMWYPKKDGSSRFGCKLTKTIVDKTNSDLNLKKSPGSIVLYDIHDCKTYNGEL